MESELRKFMATHGITDRMPSYTELREAGAYALLSALSKHRGMATFAKRLGYASLESLVCYLCTTIPECHELETRVLLLGVCCLEGANVERTSIQVQRVVS